MAKYGKLHPYHERYKPIDGYMCIEHPYYSIWANMISRCCNSDDTSYVNYGGRDISVCDRWRKSFEAFALDMGKKKHVTDSLDRIDNDKGYFPGNCKWSSRSEQSHNRRKFKNNSTGEKGIVLKEGRFSARWDNDGVRYQLGHFATVDEAKKYRDAFINLFHMDRKAALQMTERRARYDSSTGVKGISKHTNGYVVRKTINGTRIYMGFRKTFDEAVFLWNATK